MNDNGWLIIIPYISQSQFDDGDDDNNERQYRDKMKNVCIYITFN